MGRQGKRVTSSEGPAGSTDGSILFFKLVESYMTTKTELEGRSPA